VVKEDVNNVFDLLLMEFVIVNDGVIFFGFGVDCYVGLIV